MRIVGALSTEEDPQCQILTQLEQKASPRFYRLGKSGRDNTGELKDSISLDGRQQCQPTPTPTVVNYSIDMVAKENFKEEVFFSGGCSYVDF